VRNKYYITLQDKLKGLSFAGRYLTFRTVQHVRLFLLHFWRLSRSMTWSIREVSPPSLPTHRKKSGSTNQPFSYWKCCALLCLDCHPLTERKKQLLLEQYYFHCSVCNAYTSLKFKFV